MELGDLLTPEAVIPSLKAKTKKQALQELAEKAAALTGLARPRRPRDPAAARAPGLDGGGPGHRHSARAHGGAEEHSTACSRGWRRRSTSTRSTTSRSTSSFLLLAPEHAGADHLKALARISRLLREPQSIEKLRASHDRAALYAVLTQPAAVHAA